MEHPFRHRNITKFVGLSLKVQSAPTATDLELPRPADSALHDGSAGGLPCLRLLRLRLEVLCCGAFRFFFPSTSASTRTPSPNVCPSADVGAAVASSQRRAPARHSALKLRQRCTKGSLSGTRTRVFLRSRARGRKKFDETAKICRRAAYRCYFPACRRSAALCSRALPANSFLFAGGGVKRRRRRGRRQRQTAQLLSPQCAVAR
jgi:hypothetical protein